MVRVAQIGCGHWGKNLARNFHEIGNLATVVDGDPSTASKMSELYDVPARQLEDVLADPNIDAVAFATPAEQHADHARQALQAGKHCYVEKPLALDIEDAAGLIELAEQRDLRLMVGHLLQYHPCFITLKRLVQEGKIGKLQYVYSNRMSLGKLRLEENVLWSFAPHDFSMVLALADEKPKRITAQGSSFVTPGVVDWCTVQFSFPSGASGHVQVSWLHPFKEQRLVVIGDEGMLVFDDSTPEWDEKLSFYGHRIDQEGGAPVTNKADAEFVCVQRGEPLKDECRHFVESIENGSKPRTDGEEGLRVLEALKAAQDQLANPDNAA